MPENTNLSMDHYYQFRSELKNLYKYDTSANGDLACKVLEIRDKNRCVNSIEVSIDEGRIIIEFDPKTNEKKRKSITYSITESINNFIMDNRAKINIDDEDFNKLVNNKSCCCDVYAVGDQVTFGLF
jgi:hypothetical protein